MKKILFLLFLLLFTGCKNKAELSMERGIQYYEWDMIEKAVLEFKHVIQSFGPQSNKLDYNEIQLLSRAHHNLAVAYAKKKWYSDAADEARKAFELHPTDDNRKILELIQKKESQQARLEPASIDSSQ